MRQSVILVIFSLVISLPVQATTYYVATTGDDARSCQTAQTIGTPKRTIASGLTCMGAGDTLYLRAGKYAETIDSNNQAWPTGTSWSNAPVIAGYPEETVILAPGGGGGIINPAHDYIQYVVFDNLILDGEHAVSFPIGGYGKHHHIRFQNMEVKNGTASGILNPGDFMEYLNVKVHDNGTTDFDHGIYFWGNNNVIEECTFYRNAGWGIHKYPQGNNNIIRKNLIYDNARAGQRGDGIVLTAGTGDLVYNNIIWGNRYGISVYRDEAGAKIYNNTIVGNTYSCIDVFSSASNTLLKNNICWQNGSTISDAGSGTIEFANLTTDPKLTADFHLQSGSPAIDAGLDLSAAGITTDFDGVSRPQGSGYDIGAHEFKVGGTLRGDLNKDGKRDLADVRLLIYMLIGQQAKTPEADLTGDGAVTLADVQALIRLLVGLP